MKLNAETTHCRALVCVVETLPLEHTATGWTWTHLHDSETKGLPYQVQVAKKGLKWKINRLGSCDMEPPCGWKRARQPREMQTIYKQGHLRGKTIGAAKDNQSNTAGGRTLADSDASKIKHQVLLARLLSAHFLLWVSQSGRPKPPGSKFKPFKTDLVQHMYICITTCMHFLAGNCTQRFF